VHKHLRQRGILGAPVSRLFTDPHPTLLGLTELKPFQRFAVGWGDGVVHPDLLGQHTDGDSLLAIEAKGLGANLLTGLGQAEVYQRGVQRSFLAAPSTMLHADLVEVAKARGIGLLGVAEHVHEIHVPAERRPFNSEYQALRADIGDAAWVTESGTYSFNVPTHYLVWLIALDGVGEICHRDALRRLDGYPIPKDWRAAMRGAQKLQLMRVTPNGCQLTEFGLALRRLLPSSILEWTSIHHRLAVQRTLVDECPSAAFGLRLMLLMDPVVRLVLEGLRGLSAEGVDFRVLAMRCSEIDSRRSAIFFLKPESAANWLSPAGSVPWELVPGSDFRSTTFYQYKSVLKHAGLLAPTRLGAASARKYEPSNDIWRLGA